MLANSSPTPAGRAERNAFTLIELLVVIAVIAVLAAILFPVFAKARERARRTQCASNMRQIVMAISQYTQVYDERFPWAFYNDAVRENQRPSLIQTLQPFTGREGLERCPSDTGEVFLSDGRGFGSRTEPFWKIFLSSYDWPGRKCPTVVYAGRRINEVHHPSITPILYEMRPWHGLYRGNEDPFKSPALYNIAYCDGHVATRTHAQWFQDQADGLKL